MIVRSLVLRGAILKPRDVHRVILVWLHQEYDIQRSVGVLINPLQSLRPQRSSDIEIEEPDANVAVGVENSECEYSPTTAPPSPQGDMEIEIPQENEFVERSKRRHDDEADDVERELKRERLDELLDDNALGLFWEETTDPVFTISQIVHMPTLPATGPNMLVENLTSIRYDSSLDHVKQEVTLGFGKVLVWRPTEAIDDSTLAQVNVEQCFAGMCDEVNNMEACVF